MPYILNPTSVAMSIGASCGGKEVSADTPLMTILGLLLPRLEDLMDVASLTYGETTDTFDFSDASSDNVVFGIPRLRLSNGYVENSEDHPVTVTDPNGETVTEFTLDARYGVILLPGFIKGRYTVSYYAGLKTADHEDGWEEGDPEYFADVPPWMAGVVTELMVIWFRTSQKQLTLPQQIRYHEMVDALDKELKRRVYMRYQRPRDAEWAVTSVRTDGMLT